MSPILILQSLYADLLIFCYDWIRQVGGQMKNSFTSESLLSLVMKETHVLLTKDIYWLQLITILLYIIILFN